MIEVKEEVTEDIIPDIPELPGELGAVAECAASDKKTTRRVVRK